MIAFLLDGNRDRNFAGPPGHCSSTEPGVGKPICFHNERIWRRRGTLHSRSSVRTNTPPPPRVPRVILAVGQTGLCRWSELCSPCCMYNLYSAVSQLHARICANCTSRGRSFLSPASRPQKRRVPNLFTATCLSFITISVTGSSGAPVKACGSASPVPRRWSMPRGPALRAGAACSACCRRAN